MDNDEDVEEVVMEDELSQIPDPRHRRSSSTTAPLPPPNFNPPADSPVLKLDTISPPDPLPQSTDESGDLAGSTQSSSSSGTARPPLRTLQSQDSAQTPQSLASDASSASARSEGGQHLVEARNSLRSEPISASTSRSNSTSTPPVEASTSDFELNVINPTPPLQPEDSIEAGPSETKSPEDSGESAWDSVWPAPGIPHRPSIPPDPGRPNFPIAPVSPFITPSFSPAFLPSAPSRLPSSPVTPNGESASPTRRSHSPNRLRQGSRDARSPQMDPQYPEGFQLGRRGSLSSYVPILSHSPPGSMPVSINKHSRSYSGSFHNSTPRSSKSSGTSPPSSPQSSPPKRQLHLQSPTQPDSAYISSPLAPPSRRSSRPSSSDGNVAKAGVIRARRKSVSAIVPESRPEQPVPSLEELPASLPPMTLPPPVTPAPPLDLAPGDDGIPIMKPAQSQTSPTSVLLSPSVRPSMARRALSDYDSQHRSTIPSLHRSSTVPAELDKSPTKRPADAESSSPVSPSRSTDSDMSRSRKSPRRSPSLLPQVSSPEQEKKAPTWKGEDQGQTEYAGDVALVDEGDVLPNVDFQMDVTFDDEGLDTLERIFLLSKSDFPFHRAYVARVLGDLLFDVDPCESVEYVLPLLSGFSLDEDESVKEAFASELHRILWYFFSTCQLNEEEEEAVVTVTSEGLNVVPVKPEEGIESELLQIQEERRQSILSSLGPSSGKTAVSTSAQTPQVIATPASEANTESTVFSPAAQLDLYSADMNPEKRAAYGGGPLVERPVIAVSFFTPLLGSLLLNPNPTVSDSVRHGLVNLVGRIRDKTDLIPEVWGKGANSADITGTKVFVSQTGSHTHQIKTFGPKARKLVEDELVHGIVVGMGQLSTEMPEGLFAEDLEDGQKAIEHYADIHNGSQSGSMTSQVEQFREQLVAEATAGRATSMNLIGSLCDFYSGEEAVENGFVHEVLRSGDGDVPVRAEGAVAISFLAKTVPVEWIYEFIPLVESYLFDPVEHVRQSICLALPAMCKRIEAIDYRRQFAVKAVSSLAQSGDNVRCAVLEMLGEIIHVFHNDPEGPPPELLEVYTADYGDFGLDGDWDVVAAFNFPGVCLTLGSDRWDELRGLYERLQTRAGDKIMRILAASLHELAKILKPGQVERDLLEVYRRCLVCNDEIRERVYEHVHEFLLAVEPATGWSLFKDLLAAWADGSLGGWRAREQLTLHLPSFSESFNTDEQGKCVLEMIKWGLLDPFAAVRNAVSQSIPKIYVVLGHDSPTATGFRELLVDLGTSSSYRQRLTFVRCLREFVRPPPNRSAFEEFFIPHLPRLSQDVVDIRLGLAQMLAGLFVVGAYYGHDAETVPPIIIQVARALAEDEAVDVRDTIRNVDVDRISKGKGIPHRISIPPPPDRAERPDHPTPLAQPLDNAIGRSGIIAPLKHTPTRRPSAEVANQLNSMNLATHNKLNEQSPPQTSDPFDASFAEAS